MHAPWTTFQARLLHHNLRNLPARTKITVDEIFYISNTTLVGIGSLLVVEQSTFDSLSRVCVYHWHFYDILGSTAFLLLSIMTAEYFLSSSFHETWGFQALFGCFSQCSWCVYYRWVPLARSHFPLVSRPRWCLGVCGAWFWSCRADAVPHSSGHSPSRAQGHPHQLGQRREWGGGSNSHQHDDPHDTEMSRRPISMAINPMT